MEAIRILQISDVHLACAFSGVKSQKVRNMLRSEQREVLRESLLPARDGRADVVVVPGDLFEHNSVDYDTIRFVQKEFASVSPLPVFVAPGNHDPYVRGSYYLSVPWPENVHIFTGHQFKPIQLASGNATVYGIANTGTSDTGNPLSGFRTDGPGIHVGILHGSCVDGLPANFQDVQCLPFIAEDLRKAGFHYVAVGHYHSFQCMPNSKQPVACYAGSLTSTGFDEEGVKCSLLVTVCHSRVVIESTPTKHRQFKSRTLNIGFAETTEDIVDALKALSADIPDGSLLRVKLIGEIAPGLNIRSDDLQQRVKGMFYYLDIDTTGLSTSYNFEAITKEDTVAGHLVRQINERLATLPEDSNERELLLRARIYALDALSGREIQSE